LLRRREKGRTLRSEASVERALAFSGKKTEAILFRCIEY
jgi:hypothetical protein